MAEEEMSGGELSVPRCIGVDNKTSQRSTYTVGVRGEIDLGARACFPDKTGLKSAERRPAEPGERRRRKALHQKILKN